ncbi:MAG TPA: AAA family ATPase, partial [Clostridiaceae bacterium]|nr:AAA family ATPase [Clostridiaceae bacterium]
MTNTDIKKKNNDSEMNIDPLVDPNSEEFLKQVRDDLRQALDSDPLVMPMVPMRHMNVFPGVSLTFEVARKRSRAAVQAAMSENEEQMLFLVSQRSLNVEWPDSDDIYSVGTQVRIREMIQLPGREILRVRVEGIERGRLIGRIPAMNDDEWDQATVQLMPSYTEKDVDPLRIEAGRRELLRSFQLYAATSGRLSMDAIMALNALENPAEQTDIIASNLNLSFEEQQKLLETANILERQSMLITFLEREIVISEYENELTEKVKAEVDKSQKEYYLREQMKVIRRELGDEQDTQEEVERYLEILEKTPVPEDYREKLEKEIRRLSNYPVSFPEAANLRTYLDTVFDLPWGEMSDETSEIAKVRAQLNADHYGLEDVKERILEYMAVRELHQSQSEEPFKAPILCFVGPPGVGKTSVAQSIAKSINRRFVRMSLGGIKDEAEIRGHRRT